MILLGARLNQRSGRGTIVIIKKTLKNVRHFYTVREARQITTDLCLETLARYYNDRGYLTRKSVFSQDRRPRKEVNAHPVIVMAANEQDRDIITGLREKDIPVEALFISHQTTPPVNEKNPVRPGLGRDLTVTGNQLLETAQAVLTQQRLVVELPSAAGMSTVPPDDLLSAETVKQSLATIKAGRSFPGQNQAELLPALAAPVWYRENFKYRPVYRTSATSTRQYK
ncbi:MAG: hypothetical protein ACLFS7_00730 [Desulfosudaceae bacterium]